MCKINNNKQQKRFNCLKGRKKFFFFIFFETRYEIEDEITSVAVGAQKQNKKKENKKLFFFLFTKFQDSRKEVR